MDHDEASGASMSFVVRVGIADVEGEVEVALWVHSATTDVVEAFRNLPVAFS